MTVIVITGGIASGKSTVSHYLQDLGVPVVDTDQIARQVVEPGQAGLQALVTAFGTEILASDGTLARPVLAQLIFHDPAQRQQLDQLLHPLIMAQALTDLHHHQAQGAQLVALDIPLYFEMDPQLRPPVDQVWLVDVSAEVQLSRLMARNQLDPEAAQARIQAQLPLAVKRSFSDHVIDNSGPLTATYQQVDQLLAGLANDSD